MAGRRNRKRSSESGASGGGSMMTRREIDRLTTEELQSKYMELQSAFDYANGRQSTKVRSRKKGRFTMRKQKLTPMDSSNRPVLAEKIGHALYRNPMAESRHLNFESRFAGELNGKLNCPIGVDPASYFRDEVENFINKIRTETVSNRNTSLREVWLPLSPEELKDVYKWVRKLWNTFQKFFDGDCDEPATKDDYDSVSGFILMFFPSYYPGGSKGLKANMAENPGKPLLNYVPPSVIAHLITHITSNYGVWKQQLELQSLGLTAKMISEGDWTANKKKLAAMNEDDRRKYELSGGARLEGLKESMDAYTKKANQYKTHYEDASDDDGAPPADDEDSLGDDDWVDDSDDFFGARAPKSNLGELEHQQESDDDSRSGDESDDDSRSGDESGDTDEEEEEKNKEDLTDTSDDECVPIKKVKKKKKAPRVSL
ncbi:hypothetical protein THAOC_01964 [Thalassiosira oceanica]|uniref:Uncharacterized protein n=1 Tax=Thalassiosira oceanica TaxID=159749 RepID=K0TGZ3_THAOC|nr:hypothetical protein THAOC_01964 [Thalassiosira oceanica]|eukprot:EJK76284.1 hypothetical protein THAOC_01964 [Thalassiosira oceanica]